MISKFRFISGQENSSRSEGHLRNNLAIVFIIVMQANVDHSQVFTLDSRRDLFQTVDIKDD